MTIAQTKTYLAVPFDEKEEAKSTAGKLPNGDWAISFDSDYKSWFAKEGADLGRLEKWLPKNRVSTDRESDPVKEFADVLESHGFILKGKPIMDGKSHRCKTVDDKKGQLSGCYRGFTGLQYGGWYIDYRNDDNGHKWRATGKKLPKEVRQADEAQNAIRYAQLQEQLEKQYRHHAQRVRTLLSLLPDATDNHPYLRKKGIPAFAGIKVDRKNRLVVPLYDENKVVWSVQRISPSGFKRMKKGARKSGLFFALGPRPVINGFTIAIAEGYSTCGSIALASTVSTVMGIDAGNLPKVAETLRKLYPDSPIVMMGDDDRSNQKNKGRLKAEEAAVLVKGRALFPKFREGDDDLTDWNDLQEAYGVKEVLNQMRVLLLK